MISLRCTEHSPMYPMIVGIASKLFSDRSDHMETKIFLFVSDHQRSQRLPKITGIESESISVIVMIVKDCQRSQRFNGKHQCSDRNDPSDHTEIKAQELQRLCVFCDLSDPSDFMEINPQRWSRSQRSSIIIWKLRVDFILGLGPKFHNEISELLFRCKCEREIISLDALVEIEEFAKINFIKQGKLLSMIPQIEI